MYIDPILHPPSPVSKTDVDLFASVLFENGKNYFIFHSIVYIYIFLYIIFVKI